MTLLNSHQSLSNQFKEFESFLIVRERFKRRKASFYAKQIQDFTESGLTLKEYFEIVRPQNEKAAETFLNNFRNFVQFQNSQYFEEFHDLRWEMGRKHKRGSF